MGLRCVIQTLVHAVGGVRGQCFDLFDVAQQFVGGHGPRFAKLGIQFLENRFAVFAL